LPSASGKAIETETRTQLQAFLQKLPAGPFGSPTRFELIAATEQDRQSLKGVGTYGVIKNAAGFIVGAMGPGDKNLEDFGYLMEEAILFATGLGLGTCWLGGSFTKSGFAKKIGVTKDESVPAVTSIGYIADHSNAADRIRRRRAGGASRLPAEQMFLKDSLEIRFQQTIWVLMQPFWIWFDGDLRLRTNSRGELCVRTKLGIFICNEPRDTPKTVCWAD